MLPSGPWLQPPIGAWPERVHGIGDLEGTCLVYADEAQVLREVQG
jgi:hypothetical protein